MVHNKKLTNAANFWYFCNLKNVGNPAQVEFSASTSLHVCHIHDVSSQPRIQLMSSACVGPGLRSAAQ